jgi:uncharacterized phage protein gp47/JayE
VDNVVATYRFGAGAAAPPAGAITQLARPVKGIRGVRSPLAAAPGKDPEDAAYLRKYAPRTALLLGRAVSAADFEALANKSAGVTRAVATWGWIEEELQAGVQILYIGDTDALTLEASLRNFADPTLPVRVIKARAVRADLTVELEISPSADRSRVEDEVRRALIDPEEGVLAARNIPIRSPLWLSRVFDVITNVPGVVSVATFEVRARTSMKPLHQFPTGHVLLIKKFMRKPDLARDDSSLCATGGDYFDFTDPESVPVTALKEPLGPITSPRPELPKVCR